ncbi:hypothetical protein Pint_35912 [Pistacia integerrima]|uniref:Uncharacterized protein n=4 Tax=Pistacia TaxID=55512 RepID=A0ACC1CDS6_9ROSI|nr:hypothetical protein Pint_33111 [Pistacia integerrima]KAJ0020867.1 hypothetical protein Pint_31044 [Pistacia integerrima]KAJ0028164.1 hypothetical protein Pint_35912 [Pistacia integerrima]KAJ0113717.1 hypothetical protein Patl1_01912 [Pistacia atlantica]
METPHRSLIG